MKRAIVLVGLLLGAPAGGAEPSTWDEPITCAACDAWNAKREPFRVFGNTYYVGVAGLSAVLIASESGLVLLDGGLPQSAPLIAENIRSLGFRVEAIRLIVNSHAHFDHAGGIAALQRASGAMVAASPAGARALKRGEPVTDDPQYAVGRPATRFPRVSRVRIVRDGEVLRVGELAVTAHLTPGHTPGSTTWTWRSCDGARCLDVVYADSLTPVSAPGFKFTRGPGLVEAFRRSIREDRGVALRHPALGAPGVLGPRWQARAARAGGEPRSVHRFGRLPRLRRCRRALPRPEDRGGTMMRGQAGWRRGAGVAILAIGALLAREANAAAGDDAKRLRALHEKVLRAHRQSDVDLLLEDEAADYVVANRGEVTRPSLEERRQRLGGYLRRTTFREYRDAEDPVVQVSRDGTLGWVIVKVRARGTQQSPDGSKQPVEFISAWVELYEKRAGRWYRVGNVSNFKP